jgi:ribonuclease Z
MSLKQLVILGCSAQQPTRQRNQGAYLLRWREEGLLIDPGEGTQRQFIFADIAPTCVTRIFVSHFHGDHCLGLGSMIMRLNLDKVTHPIHCYYPASGQKYFERLRHGTIYRENVHVVPHPVEKAGIVAEDDNFIIEAAFLQHGVDNIGWRITERDQRKFYQDRLNDLGIKGLMMRELIQKGFLTVDGKRISIDDVSYIRKGESFASVIDTRYCQEAVRIAKGAKTLLCESTYLEEHKLLAENHHHLTAKQAALIAKEAGVEQLILTHFSARYSDLQPFCNEAAEIFPNVEVADDLKKFNLI